MLNDKRITGRIHFPFGLQAEDADFLDKFRSENLKAINERKNNLQLRGMAEPDRRA